MLGEDEDDMSNWVCVPWFSVEKHSHGCMIKASYNNVVYCINFSHEFIITNKVIQTPK